MRVPKLSGFVLASLVSAATVVACENTYTYVPTTSATVSVAGRVAASYAIPSDDPRGTLAVASFGFADITAPGAPDEQLSSLHLRMVLVNNGDTAWSLDTSAQRLDLEQRGAGAPAFASADTGTQPPIVTVGPASRRVVDLFFLLPADMQGAQQLPSFDAVWQVNTGDRIVTGRTPFARLVVQPEPASVYEYGPYDYWGPPYWYNAYYVSSGFRGEVAIPPRMYRHPVIIHRGIHHGEHRGPFHGPPPAPHGAPPHGGHR